MKPEERCNAELELDTVFVCQRAKGHTLVHVDNSYAREVGVPAWSMVWAQEPEVVAGQVLDLVVPPMRALS